MRFGRLRFAETDMLNTAVGILLILVVGMCLVAFPFVLWTLFGDGPRSRRKRRTSRPRGEGTTGSSGWRDDRKKARPRYDEADE
jgi:hypothetical protein